MNMVQVYIKGQEDKELSSFLRYYPVRIKNIGMDAFFDRQVIYDFKDGRNHADVAKCVAKMLVKKFGRKVRSVVFSCVPASSQERNEARNKNFSELVCKFSGAINGFSHVKVVGERTAVHGTKVKKDEREKRLKEKNNIEVDASFFKNKIASTSILFFSFKRFSGSSFLTLNGVSIFGRVLRTSIVFRPSMIFWANSGLMLIKIGRASCRERV